jgi:serine/threonine protein kinase
MDNPNKIGRYEIVEEKGRGAMGAVYLARDPAMDRIVALKTIHSLALSGPQGKEYRERFYGEARAAGRLAHPGIVPVFDVGEQDGVPFLVMEYIEGQTLADAAKAGQRLTLERVCEIGQQIAEALGYAHKNGVVHRDIKPANILLTSKGKYGIERPKITDFGVAKLATSHLTTTGQLLGTPAFMPPEQFTGAVIDGRSDLFSFGVILYWLATGDQAFPGDTVTAVSYKVVHTEPVPPRKLNPAIPADLEKVILRCLAKDPAARYQTGEDLAHDLAAIRAGHAPQVRPARPITAAPLFSGGMAGGTMDVTLDSDPSRGTLPAIRQTAASAVAPQTVARSSLSRGARTMVMVSAAVVALLGAWYVSRRKTQPQPAQAAVATTAPSANASSAPNGGSASATNPGTSADNGASPTQAETPADVAKSAPPRKSPKPAKPETAEPVATVNKAADLPTPATASATAPSTPAPPVIKAAPAHVDFDPAALKPNKSAKLRIEADHFPASLGFTLEMDGKVYFERGAKTQRAFDNLFAPPGLHEFRVVAGFGSNRKTSNIVSTEFRPKKRKTLRIELRNKGVAADAATPQAIEPDSQLVLTLK